MKSPFTGGKAILLAEKRKIVFRNEEYEYTHLFYKCKDTGQTFTTTQLDSINMWQVYNCYKAGHRK